MAGFQERWLIGKAVARVNKERGHNTYYGRATTAITSIEFTDGSRLIFNATPTEHEMEVSATYIPAKRRR